MRRMVYTKEDIYISFVGEEFVRDRIPLAEVLRVDELGSDFIKNIATNKHDKGALKTSNLFRADSVHERINNIETAIVLTTIDRGYNSGRAYHILPNSPTASSALLNDLIRLSKAARRRLESNQQSWSQAVVRKLMCSRAMSACTAFLLFVVCAPLFFLFALFAGHFLVYILFLLDHGSTSRHGRARKRRTSPLASRVPSMRSTPSRDRPTAPRPGSRSMLYRSSYGRRRACTSPSYDFFFYAGNGVLLLVGLNSTLHVNEHA